MTTPAAVLNFVLIGESRSGLSVLQSSIDNHPDAVCHSALLHSDDKVRRSCHEGYFGPSLDPEKNPDWFVIGTTNPWRYLTTQVWDRPLHGETTVGLRVDYSQLSSLELYDLFSMRCREGDFCVIHLLRNPVACLTSKLQADRSKVAARWSGSKETPSCPPPIVLTSGKVVDFVRAHMSVRGKIAALCEDRMELHYRDLFFDYERTMASVFEFLSLPPAQPRPSYLRLRNRAFPGRISNLNSLRCELPSDVRAVMDEDLF